MRTSRSGWHGEAGYGLDPLGSAARLRLARLDPGSIPVHLAQLAADAAVLAMLLAVPGLSTLLASALLDAPATVPAVAFTLAGLAVLGGTLVLWPRHDGGRTAGMRWAGLRVVDRRGAVPGNGALAIRALLVPVDLLVGPALVSVRADRRVLGDLLAGTRVVCDLSASAARAGHPGTARIPRARSHRAAPARTR